MKRNVLREISRCSSVKLMSDRPQMTHDDLQSLRSKQQEAAQTSPPSLIARLAAVLTGKNRARPAS